MRDITASNPEALTAWTKVLQAQSPEQLDNAALMKAQRAVKGHDRALVGQRGR